MNSSYGWLSRFPALEHSLANSMRANRAGLVLLGAVALTWCQSSVAFAQSETRHWAYESPIRPSIPATEHPAWPENAIDALTHAMMTQHGLSPSPEATRHALIRRVTLDLTGLPPTPDELSDFLADVAPGAYERVVDRLLQSPRFGERMATHWLDLARYADTHGYHMDAHRDMWRWRDWVIEAYNDDMPFDQFTIEQLAGDLLPNATLSQRIATGFNRNNMVNFENGVIADEFLAEYAIDRVATTSTVWLGQTMVCARCHDHKYDPFTQREFYQLFAFFNQVPERGVDGDKGNAVPFTQAPLPHQIERIKELERRRIQLEAALEEQLKYADEAVATWEAKIEARHTRVAPAEPQFSLSFEQTTDELDRCLHGTQMFVPGKVGDALLFDGRTHLDLSDQEVVTIGDVITLALWIFPTTFDSMVVTKLERESRMSLHIGLEEGRIAVRATAAGGEKLARVVTDKQLPRSQWQHVTVTGSSSNTEAEIAVFVNGLRVPTSPTDDSSQSDVASKASFTVGSNETGRSFRGKLDELRVFTRELTDHEIAILAGGDPIRDILAVAPNERTPEQAYRLKRHYLEQVDARYRDKKRELDANHRSITELKAALPTTMVMQDLVERRPTYVLNNGRYDSRGEVVQPGVPSILPPLPDAEAANRLVFAQWMIQPDHPLTSRVTVNHLWQLFFGEGLVRTPEDFGTRGEPPTHPQLLDWLATEFAEDWDVKRLVRMLVTSATYRQSSQSTPELAATDPDNRWLARASRLRLSAEMVRDGALFAGGLLVERTGGPSVFPYQPEGLWEEIAYNANDFTAQVYHQSHGADLYRRSLYTFVKRSAPSPALAAFDAPNRETCVTSRPRTNTPQQALVLMNDVTFVEAARAMAGQTLAACDTTEARIDHLLFAAAGRQATQAERRIFTSLTEDLQTSYENDLTLADSLIAVGESSDNRPIDQIELAVWTAVANVILSLDEVITRP